MKKLIKASILAGGALVASHSAMAGTIPGDLYMGFQNQAGNATSDYIVNLGSITSLMAGSPTVNLSGDFSLSNFNTVLGASSSLYAGVAGGTSGGTATVYATELRGGGAGGDFLIPGTESAPGAISHSQDSSSLAALSNITGPAVNTGALDATLSWENYVEPTFTTQSFYGASGINPDSQVGTTSVVYEDLWETTSSSLSGTKAFDYLGYFTIDATGSSLDVTFTATPEPGTYALAGVGSLLLFALRRRSVAQKA